MSQQLQNKLFNYYALPPLDVWDKITVILDEEVEPDFSDRLANYHVIPPVFIWDNIAASLDENKSPVLPFTKRYEKPLRYGSVAASLLFAVILINLLIAKKSVSGDGAIISEINQSISAPQASKKTIGPSKNLNEVAANKSENFIYTKREGENPVKVLPLRSGKRNSNARFTRVLTRNEPIVNYELLDRYSIFSNTSGGVLKVSKKLFNLFLCSERNEYCKLNIAMVQGRVASPSVLASADFSGVLDLLQTVNNQ